MPLAFLSPKIVKAIVEGRHPAELSIISLARPIDVPLLWTAQQQVLGLGDSFDVSPPILPRNRQLGPAKWRPGDRRGIRGGTQDSPRSLVPKPARSRRRRALFGRFSEDS